MSRPLAIVTGGRRGIGLAVATALAGRGFDIAVTDRVPPAQAADALDAIRAAGGRAEYFASDLADLAGHAATVGAIAAAFGRIDVLVNNAGIGSPVRGDFLDLAPETFDAVMDVNLRGTVFFTQAVARHMLASQASGARSIITVSSASAELASPDRLDYCMSKAALAMFTKGLALRLAEAGIGVFEIRPGIIRSDMTAGVKDKYDRLIGEGVVPMRRWGEGGDIGRIAAALASGDFAFATGSVIDAGGGLTIGRL